MLKCCHYLLTICMSSTKLLYLDQMFLYESPAHITEVRMHTDGRTVVVLDQTVFYPQGGGQPYDKGIITAASRDFIVEEVRKEGPTVLHIGHFEKDNFTVGEEVICRVDKERRLLMCRLHSGGHLIDIAAARLNISWKPTKGYHFPDGPYIEYEGTIDMQPEELCAKLNEEIPKLIKEDMSTQIVYMQKAEAAKRYRYMPDGLPDGVPLRVVAWGEFGTPCGGTHVASLGEIKSVHIRKVKHEKGKIRVSYELK